MVSYEEGIATLFKEIDDNSKIIKFEQIKSHENFSVLVRTKFIKTEDDWAKTCNKWLEKFTVQTNSKWVVKASYPRAQRMEYRKVYVCKEKKKKSCKGKVDIKIKKVTKDTIRNDKLLETGYNAEIKVLFDHSHDR